MRASGKYFIMEERKMRKEMTKQMAKQMTKQMIRKTVSFAGCAVLVLGLMTGCGSGASSGGSSSESSGGSKAGAVITVVSREDGSGTRGAFTELTGVADGDNDRTTTDAIIANSTEIVMTDVAQDENAIGYISLGSLNDTVKALKVDGVEATADNVSNGSYKISRPFNIVTKDKVSSQAQDFINFILSDEGQKVVTDNGYVAIKSKGSFKSNGARGKVSVAGSSSVTPVMEKLQEAYEKENKKVDIEVNESDSTTGVNSAADGKCDIGMASRDLDDSEKGKGITATAIANDGIAVIVNKDNDKLEDISMDTIKSIFTGETTDWADVK